MNDYDLTFTEAIVCMSKGLEVLCEDEYGPYRMLEDGTIQHRCYQAGYVTACIMGDKGAKRWKIVGLSKYI